MITIRNVSFDNGMPKICVPIVGCSTDELMQECRYLHDKPFDIIELRIDYFQQVSDHMAVKNALQAIRSEIGNTALLFTFRTKNEGGVSEYTETDYFSLNQFAIQTGLIDAIDLELFRDHAGVQKTISAAKNHGVTVIMSNHDFQKTPSYEEIINRLCTMKSLGADIAKLACMPHTPKDVLTLLDATAAVKSQYPDTPIITMSMGKLGVISRISGETFGSAMTFGSAKKASAPGQLDITALHSILHTLHGSKS